MPTEIELKLALEPAAATAVARHPAVRALRSGRGRIERLINSYYDTPDSLLARESVALRVRRLGDRWVQTIKGPAEPDSGGGPGGGLHARAEYEWPLTRPALDLQQLSGTPFSKIVDKTVKHGGLARRFTTDYQRRTIPLAFPDGTRASLCIDQGHIIAMRDGHRHRVPISEVELELETGEPVHLFDLGLRLVAELPLRVLTASKSERAQALLRGERDLVSVPVKAPAVPLREQATAGEALAQLARGCLQHIAANAPGLVADNDPEWVHQMRIGTRRLRSCLALVRHLIVSTELDELYAETRWLAGVLGSARDWDVFVRETLPPLGAAVAEDEALSHALKRLRARAEARRRVARATAREAVSSSRFQRLLLAGGRLCATPRFGGEAKRDDDRPARDLGERADALAADLLTRRQRKLAKRAAAVEHGSAEERHAARIAAKRLRYVGEFFAPLFPHKRAKSFLKALAALQDVLGRMNDAATALRLANESSGGARDAAWGALRGWLAAEAVAHEPELAATWNRFAKAKPFWTRT